MGKLGRGNSAASKLSPTQVLTIRERYAQGWTQGSLCREFGVSIVQIGRIVRNEVWQSLKPGQVVLSEGEIQASAERILAALSGDSVAKLAEEFDAVLKEPSKTEPPPSPLDGGDTPEEAPGALDALQARAKAFGLDIDKAGGLV